jgi:hypothetical protein
MIAIRSLLAVLVLAFALTGCASMKSSKEPGTDLSKLQTFYVQRLPADQRGIERLLSDRLNAMGYKSTSGMAEATPQDIDAVVTYQDKWMWDITMYMIQLDVQVRDPGSQVVMASATSYRPSLQRVAPDKMVEEVVNEIFKQ